jgi:hypothetical protein
MINDAAHGIWRFQDIVNRAVVDRLECDSVVVRRLKEKLASNPTVNEVVSLPRYLMASGRSDEGLQELCRSKLQDEARHVLPRAGYDAVDDSIIAVSRSLFEALAPSFSP